MKTRHFIIGSLVISLLILSIIKIGQLFKNKENYHSLYRKELIKNEVLQIEKDAIVKASLDTTRLWYSIVVNPSTNDVWACASNGDIYKSIGGTGAFIAQSAGTRIWYGISVNPSKQFKKLNKDEK